MISKEQKVFGLGLSKTGTSSLSEALNQLGIKTIHYPCDDLTLRELQSGKYRLTLMNKWQGAVDISVAPFYARLDQAFPASKFILTIREKESWLRSCEQHWALMNDWLENFPEVKRFQEFIGAVTYGALKYNRERFSEVYDTHVEGVRRYFRGREKDFLEINICGGQGWRELCRFLGCEAPGQPFPRANEWMHLLIEARQNFYRHIPAGKKVLLIDQQGFGSSFAPEHELYPFLERDGIYWGIPEDDAMATRELTRLFDGGIEYVAIGFPCFWWLAYFPEFEKKLRHVCESLFENRSVKIFRKRNS